LPAIAVTLHPAARRCAGHLDLNATKVTDLGRPLSEVIHSPLSAGPELGAPLDERLSGLLSTPRITELSCKNLSADRLAVRFAERRASEG